MSKYSHRSGCNCTSCRKIESVRRRTGNSSWNHRSNCGCSNCRQVENLREQAELSKRIRESKKARNSSGSSGCFLTTAACTYYGLPDDCAELTALRKFRDSHLLATPKGRAMVSQYYQIAPSIVEKLTDPADFASIWQAVNRTIAAIEAKNCDEAIDIYKSMLESLTTKFWRDANDKQC